MNAAYLPGVIVGLAFHRKADAGDATALLRRTNWVLVAASSALALVWVADAGVGVTVALFMAAQIVLSIVKLVNKAYIGRFVRDGFDGPDGARVLQRSVSFVLVGGAAGGVLLDVSTAGWTFVAAAALYRDDETTAPIPADGVGTRPGSVVAARGGRRFL